MTTYDQAAQLIFAKTSYALPENSYKNSPSEQYNKPREYMGIPEKLVHTSSQ
ncbi:hypothetical protein GCM10022414_25520 [Zhongshania borealis]|uniref:Uncharacterized protein n=1 Tax=Zhongshania borealis TaxID=889488 RepID=A0ABP7WY13_9GAMM